MRVVDYGILPGHIGKMCDRIPGKDYKNLWWMMDGQVWLKPAGQDIGCSNPTVGLLQPVAERPGHNQSTLRDHDEEIHG